MLPDWINDYIGIPFVDGGRDRAGCDCYGLVRLVLAEQFAIDAPSYHEDYRSADDRAGVADALEARRGGRWQEITEARMAQAGDVAVFRVGGLPLHCGLLVSPDRMLHVAKGCETVVEPIDGPVWKNRLVGLYRYLDLC
ncbi:MAG: C40 family peptidase [Nitrospirales bacterium]